MSHPDTDANLPEQPLLSEQSGQFLKNEHDKWAEEFRAQPTLLQRFLESQAGRLADAVIQGGNQAQFSLPDKVTVEGREVAILNKDREHSVGGVFDRVNRSDFKAALVQRLDELEQSPELGVAAAARLLRYATALVLVRDRLPAGRTVKYRTLPGEGIPAYPDPASSGAKSAVTEATDAIVEETSTDARHEAAVQVPYVEAARRFFLPQLVAFDDSVTPDRILVNSVTEAESYIGSMQRFLTTLHAATRIAPYMTVDEAYKAKRYGMLGQLVNQGRALSRHETRQIIDEIKKRAAQGELNRGLSLSLPYFDDNELALKKYDFQVTPTGRVMFVPAFVVRAARQEAAKVAQDTRLSRSTRKHLLIQLGLLEKAFDN